MQEGYIFQINASNGGVPKQALQEAEVTALGLVGDRQVHTKVHGGPERALCLFSLDQLTALQFEGHPIFPGAMGENLDIAGLDWPKLHPGLCLQLGDEVLIEITNYTTPCNSLVPFFMGGDYSRVSQKRFPGWSRLYARVLQPGLIKTGAPVFVKT